MELKELGLNKFESATYEALVRLGRASASKLAAAARVPYGRIYDVLESLVAKGLARVSPEKPKMYSATDPSALKHLIKKKKAKLAKLESDVKKLKKFYELKAPEPVWMSKGKIEFYRIVKGLPKPKNYEYTIKYASEFRPMWARTAKNAIERGVDIKVLTRYDEETKPDVQKWLKIVKNIRAFPNKGVAIDIIDGKIAMIALIKSNITMIIRDEAFVKLVKDMFLNAWEKAEKIK